jgi:hypothetical protein
MGGSMNYFLLFISLLGVPVLWAARDTSISGTVLKWNEKSDKNGIQFQLYTDEGVVNVRVAQHEFSSVGSPVPRPGDPVTVTGFRFTFDKEPEFVAEEIKINKK